MDWHGIAALVLTAGISLALVILIIGAFFHGGHITDGEATTISTILGAGIGALATYLGGKIGGDGGDK